MLSENVIFSDSNLNFLCVIMSEMLANQYFLVRRFKDAETAFEKVIAGSPSNKSVKKKLIICYVYNGQIKKALNLFYAFIKEDIDFIVNTDLVADDCPCPELIDRFEKVGVPMYSTASLLEVFGILWLYCDISKSISCFEKLRELNPSEKMYKDILKIYSNYTLKKIRTPHS